MKRSIALVMLLGFGGACVAAPNPKAAQIWNNLGAQYYQDGRYREAERLYRKALAAWPEGSEDRLRTAGNLAVLCQRLARFEEAEPLFREVIDRGQPRTAAVAWGNLAELYRRQEQYGRAEDAARRAISMAPGLDAPVLTLAAVLNSTGRSAEAASMFEALLARREKSAGAGDPVVAKTLTNLASVYLGQRRYADAEPPARRAVAILEATAGPAHPDTAAAINNLAQAVRLQGRFVEAERLYHRSLDIWAKALGKQHPDFADGLQNLADLETQRGDYRKAETLLRRAMEIHATTARATCLAEVLRAMGRGDEAATLLARSMEPVAHQVP